MFIPDNFNHRCQLAEADLSSALKIDPCDPQLLYKRGIARYADQRYSEAIADLKSSIGNTQRDDQQSINLPYLGNSADIYFHLGLCYANLGKHQLAVPAFDRAILHCPNKPHYLHERAKCSQVVGNHAESIIDFTRVLEMQPTNARALFRRGFSYKALKKYTEAAEDFEAAKEFAPDDPRLVLDYGNPKLHEVYENTFIHTKFHLIQVLIQKISLSKFE